MLNCENDIFKPHDWNTNKKSHKNMITMKIKKIAIDNSTLYDYKKGIKNDIDKNVHVLGLA